MLRAYRVVLDGDVVAQVKRAEAITLETASGHHELHLTVDWARSPSVELDLADGQEAVVRCWPHVNPLLAWYWMTAGRNRWIGIEVIGEGTPSAPGPSAE